MYLGIDAIAERDLGVAMVLKAAATYYRDDIQSWRVDLQTF
jgi:hypothetical protein